LPTRAEVHFDRSWSLALLLLPLVAFLGLAHRYRWTCDDAFVSFRVVGNLLAGYGPNFNVGERIEAFTNPLWVALLSILSAIFGIENIEIVAVTAGILMSAAGLAFAMLASVRIFALDGLRVRIWLPFMCLSVIGIRAYQEYASSGLETGLSFFLLGLSLFMLFRPERGSFVWTALVLSLLPLNRPDFGIYWLLFAAYLLYRARASRVSHLALILLALVVIPASYQVFRMGYFASLVPNTALAKEASLAYWEHGFEYLKNFVMTYRLQYLIPAYLVVVIWIASRPCARHLRHALFLCGLAATLHATYITRVGGDFMHARLLLTDYFLLVAPLALIPVLPGRPGRVAAALCAALVVWSIVSVLYFELPYEGVDSRHYINNEYTVWAGKLDPDDPINVIEVVPAEELLANTGRYHIYGNAGIEAFKFTKSGRYDVIYLEYCGLSSPITARHLLESRSTIGHEKCREPLADPWIAAYYRELEPRSSASASDVALAREVIENSILGEYLEAITGPLALRKFFGNIADSVVYSRLRIPPLKWLREVPPSRRNAETFDGMMIQRRRFAAAGASVPE
jgi:arabinofuranosyltransferase